MTRGGVSNGQVRRRYWQGTLTSMMALVMTMVLGLASTEAAPTLPVDGRLEPARARLSELVRQAAADGLPADLIVIKVQEGLAKGIDPARIEAAATKLTENLTAAQRYVAERRPGQPPTRLVRAVAEARQAGVPLAIVDPLVRSGRADAPRAVEVLTDLSLRGYPADRAAPLVQNVAVRDAAALERVSGTLETIRQDYTLSHGEAVDALARGLASSDSLQKAYSRTAEDERRRGRGKGAGKGADGESPGKSGLTPGQLKKKGLPFLPPGLGKKP
jgi:hypothetical protein